MSCGLLFRITSFRRAPRILSLLSLSLLASRIEGSLFVSRLSTQRAQPLLASCPLPAIEEFQGQVVYPEPFDFSISALLLLAPLPLLRFLRELLESFASDPSH